MLKLGWVVRSGVLAATLIGAPVAPAFTPLGFPSFDDIEAGRVHFWQRAGVDAPFTLSFAVDAGFLSSESSVTPDGARAAALRAVAAWTSATQGHIAFSAAPWSAVPNNGAAPPFAWEGPGWDEWIADRALPPHEQQYADWVAGWGANIDIFSRPGSFTITSAGQTFTMGPTVLAFSIVNRSGNRIHSVDIYLNEDFDWRDGGAGGFDIETVVVHELGHGLGLDHPQQASEQGSVNLDPFTYEPGHEGSSTDVMHHAYTGVKRVPTDDETGGMAFFYGSPPPESLFADLNGDGAVSAIDLALLLTAWGDANGHPADLDGNGFIDALDLARLLGAWTDGST